MSLFLFDVVQKIWCKLFKSLLLSFSQIWLEVCSQIWSEFFTNLIGGFSKKFELVRTTSSGGSTLPCSLFFFINQSNFFKYIWHFIFLLLIYRINALFLISQSCFWHFSLGPETGLWGKATYYWLFIRLLRFLHSSVSTWNKSPLLFFVES